MFRTERFQTAGETNKTIHFLLLARRSKECGILGGNGNRSGENHIGESFSHTNASKTDGMTEKCESQEKPQRKTFDLITELLPQVFHFISWSFTNVSCCINANTTIFKRNIRLDPLSIFSDKLKLTFIASSCSKFCYCCRLSEKIVAQ